MKLVGGQDRKVALEGPGGNVMYKIEIHCLKFSKN